MAAQRSEKAPQVVTRTRRGTQFAREACIKPVPEHVATNVSCVVAKSGFRSVMIVRNSSLNSALRWPIIGRVISRRIAGRTHVGPGTKNLQTFSSFISGMAIHHRGVDRAQTRLHSL